MSYDVVFSAIFMKIKATLTPIAFTLEIGSFSWDVHWYGIIIAVGFILSVFYGMKNAKRLGIHADRLIDVILYTTPVAILCARSYYLIFDGEKMTGGIKEFFGLSGSGFSGLAIYGGVIGAFCFGALMCYIKKIKILDAFDLAAIAFLIGQGIGRWGNFVNQEAFGTFTGSEIWGMQSERTVELLGEGNVHPCFLYESIWCIAGFVLLHYLSKKRKFSGQMTLSYGIWYGFGRTIIEGFRTDSLYLVGNIRVSQLLSALLCVGCAAVLSVMLIRIKKHENEPEYVDVVAPEEIKEITENDSEEKENE